MADITDHIDLYVSYACPGDILRRIGTDTLDHAEHARAARLSNKVRHDHFIAGRALLRHCLSGVVENAVQPETWQFVNGAYGKPAVAQGLPQVQFSISHAEGLIAVATNRAAAVGIDLELITGTKDTDPALEQLTNSEQAWLHRCSDADKWMAFLQLWTAKEAVSKATGLGCGVDFHDIEVDVPAGRARCRDGLPTTGDHMDVDLQTITADGATYCLSVACI